jgi:S-adenosylmethionine uptake transporter
MRTAFLLAAGGIALLTMMDAFIKALAPRYPLLQLVGLRFAAGAIAAGLVLAMLRPPMPTRDRVLANALRSVLVVFTATTFFFSLSTLPFAETLALSFLAPVFTALFGVLILRETIDRSILMALVFGLAGMAVMIGPKLGLGLGDMAALGAISAVASAVLYAFNLILLRTLAQRDHPVVIVAFQNTGPALLLAIPAWHVWQPTTWPDLALWGIAGAFGVAGHVLLTLAFSRAQAARLAPVEYTALIWAAGLGWAVFGEVPSGITWAGAALIVVGAVLVARR